MSEENKSKAGTTAGNIALGIALYVLSTGPVLRLAGRHPPPAVEATLATIYMPLIYLTFTCSAFDEAYDAYLKLWGAH